MNKLQFVCHRNAQNEPIGSCIHNGKQEVTAVVFSSAELNAANEEMRASNSTMSTVGRDGVYIGRTSASFGERFLYVARDADGVFVAKLEPLGDAFQFDGVPFFDEQTRELVGKNRLRQMGGQAEIYFERNANHISTLEKNMHYLDVAARIYFGEPYFKVLPND